ncbi:pyruvate dehydrogenase (acetyl-transferring), homodimeric type, partial [bacterium]|nr:pyruvate dehydrogenase (acetyl-transferring), homodimeric type [bacterium]
GESGEGRNNTHNEKKLNEKELLNFRTRFGIPLSDEQVKEAPFFRFPEDSEEHKYLQERRQQLGGYLPARKPNEDKLETPELEAFSKFLDGSGGKEASSTMAFGQIMANVLLKDKKIGERIVPIIPDEARTFGMEGLFKQCGIYSSKGQLYEPVDRDQVMYYKEAIDGQLFEEGINEAGAMSSFVAAGTAYANLGIQMIPFYIYYSMFGFQRVGDLIWLAGDSRTKGFLVGGTSGRTTLNGEGLQHEDGHSQLVATTVPNLVAYDPAYAYELSVIIQDGLKRMYQDGEDIFYYVSVYNGTYVMPGMPEGSREGILKGLYKFNGSDVENAAVSVRPQLFGSGPILECVLEAQQLLAEKYNVATDVWSATSYSELARDARAAQRWNRLHPTETPKRSYLEEVLDGVDGPIIASSDNVRLVHDQIRDWVPGTYITLGTDGFGRSDTREQLRHHFEVDAKFVTYATLLGLVQDGHLDKDILPQALKDLEIDPEKVDPLYA